MTIQLTGRYKLDRDTILKDPLVTVTNADYNYKAMTVKITCEFTNNQFTVSREMDAAPITSTDGLTFAEIKTILQDNLTLKRQ